MCKRELEVPGLNRFWGSFTQDLFLLCDGAAKPTEFRRRLSFHLHDLNTLLAQNMQHLSSHWSVIVATAEILLLAVF